jgi:hypothetical protein
MSDLSTADLAGRTAPRDPQLDNRDFDRREEQFETDGAAVPASTQRPSTLPNPAATDGAQMDSGATPLFPTGEAEGFRSRWTEVQTGFVDEPRSAVEQADGLVAEMMKRLAQVFADERSKLEEQWSRGDDISTEDLRQALRRYRSFFDRLLSV